MKISVCVPNYNYAQYVPLTAKSVLEQDLDTAILGASSLEILVSDNCSTDASVQVLKDLADDRIRVSINPCNVGFARNLDQAGKMASGDMMLMLSSDDVMLPGALRAYHALWRALGAKAAGAVVTAQADVIDHDSKKTGSLARDVALWPDATHDPALSEAVGHPVYRQTAEAMAQRALPTMKNPFNFLATAYPRGLYERLAGYGGGRMVNPDKWFHWRLLGVADDVFFVDAPLFAYRWHDKNQSAQQEAQAALKFLADEYATTLELDDVVLKKAGLTRAQLVAAFVEHDIVRHGLATLARGQRHKAHRIYDFGRATYPWAMDDSAKSRILAGLLAVDRVGVHVARAAYSVARRQGVARRGGA